MTTRYIQEQKIWVDIGSLLLGCLDFYGNSFDPRLFGISISNGGQYFRRPHYQGQNNSTPFQQNDFAKTGSNERHSFKDHDDIVATKIPSDSSRPFTFDPLFVEDPISLGNNVGRNAFRINQVQRAFSDAHRAIAASLEWDLNSGSEIHDDSYPLLKCMLSDF
jgi:DNA polymerase sigma